MSGMRPHAWEQSLEQLQQLGLTGYEAKAYLALLTSERPLSGYEAAKASGVPRGAVYETLSKLRERGLAFETSARDGVVRYLGLPLAAYVSRTRREREEALGRLQHTVPAIRPPSPASLSHNLSGPAAVQERARDLVAAARDALYVFAWPEDVETLLPDLRDAERRGAEVSLISTGTVPAVANAYSHNLTPPEVILERMGCRLLVLASDHRAVLVAGTGDDQTWGLYSEDRAIVILAEEYVRHDIALQIVVSRLGPERLAQFWNDDPVVRRLVVGRHPLDEERVAD